ncbi:MAG: HEAT repeat domain-containing protein, partial [Planctomycetota bacterium]|nr:HEAT repeat domain-containing protein [Planctomycetota bacterium]
KGALALDGSGRDAAGADVGVRVRGVTQLVVTTGTERPPVKLVPPAIEPTLAERMEARKALNAERDKVRAIVARHPERDAREELVDLLEHEHPRVRADAIQGLKRWGDTSEIMYRHLETETDAEVRGIAFNEISRIAPAEYMERLVRFVGPVKNPMNKDAAKAIKRIARRTGEPMPAGLPDWVRRGGKR